MAKHTHHSPSSDAEDHLRTLGLRKTPVRVGVLQTLMASRQPMSVPQILGKLQGVDTVTVYRTLNTLTSKKVVHKVRGEDRSWLYAMGNASSEATHRHPHFVCDGCGKVECLESAVIPTTLVKEMGIEGKYIVHQAEVVLHGHCPRCN